MLLKVSSSQRWEISSEANSLFPFNLFLEERRVAVTIVLDHSVPEWHPQERYMKS